MTVDNQKDEKRLFRVMFILAMVWVFFLMYLTFGWHK